MTEFTSADTVVPIGATDDDTHEVFNTPPVLAGYNAFDADPALGEALHREGAGWAEERARDLGALVGDSGGTTVMVSVLTWSSIIPPIMT